MSTRVYEFFPARDRKTPYARMWQLASERIVGNPETGFCPILG
jgi:hypothetical protein